MKKQTDTLVPFSAPTPSTGNPASLVDPTTLRSSVYPTSRLSPPIDPVDQTEVIKISERFIGSVVGGKLRVIYDQIQFLKEQARNIIAEAERDMNLHNASCSFEKRVGQTYYLYDRAQDQLYFSLLSPEDWRGKHPHRFIGAYRLESDMSWTEIPSS